MSLRGEKQNQTEDFQSLSREGVHIEDQMKEIEDSESFLAFKFINCDENRSNSSNGRSRRNNNSNNKNDDYDDD